MRAAGGSLDQMQRERIAATWGCAHRTIARDQMQIQRGREIPGMGTLVSMPHPPEVATAIEPPALLEDFTDMHHGEILVWVMSELGVVARTAATDGPKVSALKELRETSRQRHELIGTAAPSRPAESADAARARIEDALSRLTPAARRAFMAQTGTGTGG